MISRATYDAAAKYGTTVCVQAAELATRGESEYNVATLLGLHHTRDAAAAIAAGREMAAAKAKAGKPRNGNESRRHALCLLMAALDQLRDHADVEVIATNALAGERSFALVQQLETAALAVCRLVSTITAGRVTADSVYEEARTCVAECEGTLGPAGRG